jgi:hypothetical protein
VTIGWREAGAVVDDDGKPEPAGYVAWLSDYPEEGCIPLLETWSVSPAQAIHGVVHIRCATGGLILGGTVECSEHRGGGLCGAGGDFPCKNKLPAERGRTVVDDIGAIPGGQS